MAKYLGIDYGTKYSGIALSDDEGTFAFPKAIVSSKDLLKEVTEILSQESVAGIVVGYSLASNGERNDVAGLIGVVAQKLESYAPVFLQEEGFSSFEAHRYQTDAGRRDDSAAAIILQRFLDKKKK